MRWFFAVLIFTGCAVRQPEKLTFGSPEETFQSWRGSVERLDLEGIISCYADAAKPSIRQEILGTSRDGLEAMRKESEDTIYRVEKIVYEGSKAYVRVKRIRGPHEEIEVISMVLENGTWKLLP